jgi:hypothetical protein
MPGETDLSIILKTLQPILNEGEYVFCQVPDGLEMELTEAISFFRENEGTTIIISKSVADQKEWNYSSVFAWITLRIHSSLDSVGLTAAFSNVLAAEGISCNVVAAYYHDHIFVPAQDARKTMKILEGMSK